MTSNDLVAFILAGGKGTRLESLTKKIAKPAVGFASKYRIIDFPLSNCTNTGIKTVGVIAQYESIALNNYIGNGEKWGLNGRGSIVSILTPRQTEDGANWYRGTADAFYQNIDYIDEINPEYVLILSGDHIYNTTYTEMFKLHVANNADCTISVIRVDMKEASRFGIISVDDKNVITEFNEKPKMPNSDLASMGIYIFKYSVLRKLLIEDAKDDTSSHDFGKNIIPMMLKNKMKLLAYQFNGYWRDVGTISSLHQANMDLLGATADKKIDIANLENRIYTEDTYSPPVYIGKKAKICTSIVNQGAIILGEAVNSVISSNVMIENGAFVNRSVIMEGAIIEKNAMVNNAIIAPHSIVPEGAQINLQNDEVVLYAKKGAENA